MSIKSLQKKGAEVILLTDRQTDKRTRAKTFASSFVGGNNWQPMLHYYFLLLGPITIIIITSCKIAGSEMVLMTACD